MLRNILKLQYKVTTIQKNKNRMLISVRKLISLSPSPSNHIHKSITQFS